MSLFISSLVILVVPVSLGRWMLLKLTSSKKLHELYTIFTGLYTIWLTIRLSTLVYNWFQMGLFEIFNKFKSKFLTVNNFFLLHFCSSTNCNFKTGFQIIYCNFNDFRRYSTSIWTPISTDCY